MLSVGKAGGRVEPRSGNCWDAQGLLCDCRTAQAHQPPDAERVAVLRYVGEPRRRAWPPMAAQPASAHAITPRNSCSVPNDLIERLTKRRIDWQAVPNDRLGYR